MKLCIEKLSSHEISHVISAAGILSNLTCNDYINKTKFVEQGGVKLMVRIVQRARNGFKSLLIILTRRVAEGRLDDFFLNDASQITIQ